MFLTAAGAGNGAARCVADAAQRGRRSHPYPTPTPPLCPYLLLQIVIDNHEWFGIPSYYVQKMFREAQGTHYLATSVFTDPTTEVRICSLSAAAGLVYFCSDQRP